MSIAKPVAPNDAELIPYDRTTGEVIPRAFPPVRKVRSQHAFERLVTVITGESMTQQSHLDQTDVNAIVARFERTGQFPPPVGVPQYGDCTGLQVELTEALARAEEIISTAREFADGWRPPEPEPVAPPAPTPPTE